MTLDEILTEYEDVWREAALNGDTQWHPGSGMRGYCAMAVDMRLANAALDIRVNHGCPFCGDLCISVGSMGIHLNDSHGWTWLDFANKFRSVLLEQQP